MPASRRYCARPAIPPKPPRRTGTGCARGESVRPASDKVTATSVRAARSCASCRASVVPPRIRICLMSLAEITDPQTAAVHPWLSIVGIGEDGIEGLNATARGLIQSAAVVFGGARHLALAASLIRGTARPWAAPFDVTVAEVLTHRGRAVCVLASGDPFFHGVGSVLSRHVPREETLAVPAPSAFSIAASRLLWPLPQTVLLSLCGRPLDLLRPHLHPGARILVLTSGQETPAQLARLLCETGFGRSQLTVLEALAGPHERIRAARADAFDLEHIDSLNTVAIEVAAEPGA